MSCYDFDGAQHLSVDEVTLALKSATTGLCKLSAQKYPREEVIEQLVSEVHCYLKFPWGYMVIDVPNNCWQ